MKESIECVIINGVCYEGDNRMIACRMFDVVMKTIGMNVQMKEVDSWNNSTLWGDIDDDTRASMF